LARAMRALAYGEKIAAAGPVAQAASRNGDAIVVSFADVEGGLVAYGAPGPIGFEVCGEEAGSCRYAQAEIWNHRVTLRAPGAHQATRVRYCWADSPVCTLYDRSGSGPGQPAGPFEIAVSPMPYDDHAR